MSNDFRVWVRHLLPGLGWSLLGFGGFMIIPGILSMTRLFPLDLEFFGIDVDTQRERLVWTVGSIISAVCGYVLLRRLKGNDEEW